MDKVAVEGNETEPTEVDRKIEMIVAGNISAAGIRAGRLYWTCDMHAPNIWWRQVPWPHGVGARDIPEHGLYAGIDGITLVTRRGDLFVWEAPFERWTRRANLFNPPPGAR